MSDKRSEAGPARASDAPTGQTARPDTRSARRPDARALADMPFDQQVQMFAPGGDPPAAEAQAAGRSAGAEAAQEASADGPQQGGCGGGGGGPASGAIDVETELAAEKPDPATIFAALRNDSGILAAAERECQDVADPAKEKAWHDALDAKAAADPVCKKIATKLAGDPDAAWRARQLRLFGPESTWPPELRMNTIAIVKFARREAEAMGAPADDAAIAKIADLLRPLDPIARHQIVAQWITVPGQLGPRGWTAAHLRKLQAMCAGSAHSMAPELGQAPHIPWDTWEPPRIIEYFTKEVFPTLGYRLEPKKRNVVNIRGFVLTKAAGSEQEIVALQGSATDGHIFVLWNGGPDGTGPVQLHKGWDWTTAGSGGNDHLLQTARARRDSSVRGDKGFSGAGRATTLAATPAAVAPGESADALGTRAKTALGKAETGVAAGRALKGWKDGAVRGARLTPEQVTARKDNAGALVDTAKGAFDAANEAAACADAARAKGPAGAPDGAGMADVAARAKAARAEAEKLHKEGVDGWYVAQLRAEGGPGVPGEKGVAGVLMEGQYEGKYTGQSQIAGHDDWTLNAGVNRYDKQGNPEGVQGMAPAFRDVTGDGRMSDEERAIGAPVAGGIKIHQGRGAGDSEGCQVSGKHSDFAEFEGLMRSDRATGETGKRPEDLAYMLIDARRLPVPRESPTQNAPAQKT